MRNRAWHGVEELLPAEGRGRAKTGVGGWRQQGLHFSRSRVPRDRASWVEQGFLRRNRVQGEKLGSVGGLCCFCEGTGHGLVGAAVLHSGAGCLRAI